MQDCTFHPMPKNQTKLTRKVLKVSEEITVCWFEEF